MVEKKKNHRPFEVPCCGALASTRFRTKRWSFFFGLIVTRMRPIQIMARLSTVCFLSAVRAVAARCKRPFALRPGLSQEDVNRTKGITKEKTKENVR